MTDHFGKVLHFPNTARDRVNGPVMIVESDTDLNDIAVAVQDEAGKYSVMVFPPPGGNTAWELREPEHLENFGRYCIQLAALMRLKGAGIEP